MDEVCPKCGEAIKASWKFCPSCGGEVVAPPPAKPKPKVQLPEVIEGPCAVLRTSPGKMDITAAGKLIARATGRPLVDITVQMRRSKGLLCRDLDADAARELLPRLEETGVSALIVPMEMLAGVPSVSRASEPRVTQRGLAVELATAGREAENFSTDWADVLFVSAARFRIDISHVEEEELSSEKSKFTRRRLRRPNTREKVVVDAKFDTVIDVGIESPPLIVRLRDDRFDFNTMQRQPGDAEVMAALAKSISSNAEGVAFSEAFRVLFAQVDVDRWQEFTYLTPSAVDEYNVWLYMLASLGFDNAI